MNDERDCKSSPKRHRLARSSALAVVLMALCAPLAGAAGVQLPQAPEILEPVTTPVVLEPVTTPEVLEPVTTPVVLEPVSAPEVLEPVTTPEVLEPEGEPLPELPDLPGVDEILPAPPAVETPAILSDDTTPAPIVSDETTPVTAVDGLDRAVDLVMDDVVAGVGAVVEDVIGGGGPLEEVVDEVTSGGGPVEEVIEDVIGGDGPVEEVMDEVTSGGPVEEVIEDVIGGGGPVEEVMDEVTGGGGPVDEVVDEVTGGGGPVEEVVDEVTGGGGPVDEVVDEVTDPDGPVGGVIGGVEDGVDEVRGVVDGVVGALPDAPDVPGVEAPGDGGTDTGVTDPTGSFTESPEEATVRAERIATTISPDGFAAGVLAARETAASGVAFGPRRDVSGPSLVERIARSLSDVAQKIAFPLLLALAVGAFVIVQDRVDRKDPKLALAAIDADEDLLGFE